MLTKTQLKIVAYLIDNRDKLIGIRGLARETSTVYYLVQRNVQQLKNKGVITLEKAGKTSIVRLHEQADPAYLIEAEKFKRERFYKNHPNIKVTLKKITNQADTAFFTLLVFGSYAKQPRKGSDLDLLIITPNQKQAEIMSKCVSSVARTSLVKIHETIVTEKAFISMLKKKELNVALEAQKKHILIYGNENYHKLLQ